METSFLSSSFHAAKGIIHSPTAVFERIRDGYFTLEVSLVFGVAFLVTLVKASPKSLAQPTLTVNFFVSESLNQALSLLGNPFLATISFYFLYCVFLLTVFGMCRVFSKEVKASPLIISLMAIGAIGLIAQAGFYPLSFVLSKQLLLFGETFVYIWVVVLSILAIRTTQRFSTWRAVVCFLVPFLIFILGSVQLAIAPYLAWLSS